MHLCMNVCIRVCMCMHARLCMCANVDVFEHVHALRRVYLCFLVFACLCTCVFTCVFMHLCMSVCAFEHACVCVRTLMWMSVWVCVRARASFPRCYQCAPSEASSVRG